MSVTEWQSCRDFSQVRKVKQPKVCHLLHVCHLYTSFLICLLVRAPSPSLLFPSCHMASQAFEVSKLSQLRYLEALPGVSV